MHRCIRDYAREHDLHREDGRGRGGEYDRGYAHGYGNGYGQHRRGYARGYGNDCDRGRDGRRQYDHDLNALYTLL